VEIFGIGEAVRFGFTTTRHNHCARRCLARATVHSSCQNGATTLNQNRDHNKANEVGAITGAPDWADAGHDNAGNMTTMPQPATPLSSYAGKYDAWNRLVQLNAGAVATYWYDGLHRRVRKGTTRDFYYSLQWQILEERVSGAMDRQFVWGLRYIDDLVLRLQGSQTLYVLHDYFNPTAIINTSAVVQERYGYDGFGMPRYMNASFGSVSSGFQWETLYGAYRYDAESGLYQVRYRYLHSGLGRWTNRDPVSDEHLAPNLLPHIHRDALRVDSQISLYWYVRNTAVNNVDIYGLATGDQDAVGKCIEGCLRFPELGAEWVKACINNCYEGKPPPLPIPKPPRTLPTKPPSKPIWTIIKEICRMLNEWRKSNNEKDGK
jgi:RHS repeat-associated protein